jgi:hypothetical protein
MMPKLMALARLRVFASMAASGTPNTWRAVGA